MEELKKHKLNKAGEPGKDELPSRPFGILKEPTFEQIVGFRAEKFSDKEKETNQIIALTSEAARESAEKDKECQLSVADSVGFTGTDTDNNSILDNTSTIDSHASESSVCSQDGSVDECTRL